MPKGTKLYKNKILGLRGRATGLVFNLEPRHIITAAKAAEYDFIQLSIGVDTSYSQSSPDTFAFVLSGITTCRKKITLAAEAHNNRDRVNPLTPSDIPPLVIAFAERNREIWGFAVTSISIPPTRPRCWNAKSTPTKMGAFTPFSQPGKRPKTLTVSTCNVVGWPMAIFFL